MKRPHLPSALAGAAAFGLVLALSSMMQAGGKTQRFRRPTPEQLEILSHLSLVQLPDGTGGTAKTLRLSAADLQLVNGLGATNGYPLDPETVASTATRTNGLGNLIVGYNEMAGIDPVPFRTGSHSFVLGQRQGYTGFGGLLGGRVNGITGPYGTVLGGEHNRVDGAFCAILGGHGNLTPNTVNRWNAIGGGAENRAFGQASWIAGGQLNTTLAEFVSVGGALRSVPSGRHDWRAGTLFEDD